MLFKGFIGPLGDDIPSIFPIIGGFMLFIASIVYVGNLFDLKNEDLSKRKAAMDLSYLVTEKGFLDDAEFDSRCVVMQDFGEKRGINFYIVVQKHCNEMYLSGSNFVFSPSETVSGALPADKSQVYSSNYPASDSNYFNLMLKTLPENQPGDFAGKTCGFPATNNPHEMFFGQSTVLSYPIAVSCGKQEKRGFGLVNVMVWKPKPV